MPRPFQLLLKLPRLPFPIAFDILFRHGGFPAFARLHHCPAEAHYQFWRLYFVSSSIGKLNPAHISQWVEVMCTCHIVQSLPHPAHAVFLLRPVVREIPESVAAWSAAGGRGGNQLLDSAAVVRAMRVFLSARGWEDDAAVREWFPAAGTVSRKEGGWRQSVHVWRQFVDEAVGNHAFTRYWWTAQREGPFYLLLDNQDVSMGEMIAVLVRRERDWLEGRLRREETATMQREAERKRWRKDKLAKHDSKQQQQTPPDKRRCSSEPQAAGLVVPLPKKPTTTTPSLSSSSKSEIARLTSIRLSDHISTLAQVQQALSSMKTKTLSRQFKFVACLIVSLGHLYPRIKWSLRLLLHEAVAGARSHWAVERELYWVRYRRDGEPLRKLVGMSEKSGRGVGGRF